jgi:biopolymer transport protein ExbB/TolQ
MGDMLSYIKGHFWGLTPILAAAGIAVAITIERFKTLMITYPLNDRKQFFDRLRAFIIADRLKDAIALCNNYQHKPVAQVIREGLIRAHQPEEMVVDGLQIAVEEMQKNIKKRTPYLATIANVVTLMGLFHTISGLISSFEAVGRADPSKKSELLAAGISQAMNATMLGLGIAIPCMIIYSYLMNQTNKLNGEVSQSAIQIMDLLRQRFYNTETKKRVVAIQQAARR